MQMRKSGSLNNKIVNQIYFSRDMLILFQKYRRQGDFAGWIMNIDYDKPYTGFYHKAIIK